MQKMGKFFIGNPYNLESEYEDDDIASVIFEEMDPIVGEIILANYESDDNDNDLEFYEESDNEAAAPTSMDDSDDDSDSNYSAEFEESDSGEELSNDGDIEIECDATEEPSTDEI